jgi:hypothetical protein
LRAAVYVTEDQAWTEVMELATRHALIVQAYGGTATLAHPREQRRVGIRARTLWACNGGSLKDAEAQAAGELQ